MKKVLSLIFSLVVLTGMALAQYPVGPNGGTQTTPFANQFFSATFNGNPNVEAPYVSEGKTSTNYAVTSQDKVAGQAVVVRIIDHDIAVDYSSSDFYANDDQTGGEIVNTSRNVWEGHPFTYVARKYTSNGTTFLKRTRYIIVGPREALFIVQIVEFDANYTDQNEWLDFEYSLRIK